MYALASFGVVPGLLGLRAFVLAFCVAGAALQGHFSKGPDVRSGVVLVGLVPGRGLGSGPACPLCILRGRRGTSGSPRGLMYALASFGVVAGLLGLRAFVLAFCVAGAAL